MLHERKIGLVFYVFSMVILLCGLSTSARGYTYAIQNLGILDEDYPLGSDMWVGGINAKGDVVGSCWPSEGNGGPKGFISSGGQQIEPLKAIDESYAYTHALGINDKGLIVGRSGIESAPNADYACLWSGNTVTNLDPLGSGSSAAYWINNSGQIIGDFQSYTQAFFYENGTMTDLGALGGYINSHVRALNAKGQVIGNHVNTSDQNRSFFYSNGTITEIPTLGGISTWANDINNKGWIVGYFSTYEYSHAFIYANGSISDLNTLLNIPVYYNSQAKAINDSGQITGFYTTEYSISHAFLYTNGTITDLETEFEPFCLNNRGQALINELNNPFLYSGGVTKNLNDLIDSTLGWNIYDPWYGATGTEKSSFINDSGQILGVGTMEIDGWPIHRPFIMTPFPWKAEGGGSWTNVGNWNVDELPGNVGDSVYFSNWFGNTSGGNIILDGDRTISGITFNNFNNSFTISAGKLIMDNTDGSSAMIIDVAGTHYITTPVELHTNLIVKILDYCVINISGQISESGGEKSLTKTGEGKAILSASNSYIGETLVEEGILELASTGQISPDSPIYTETEGTFQVNGGVHTVGTINGTGTTILLDNSEVTATCIVQGHISIGSGARLIIAPSGGFMAADNNLSSVPEPSVLVLLGIGAMILIIRRFGKSFYGTAR